MRILAFNWWTGGTFWLAFQFHLFSFCFGLVVGLLKVSLICCHWVLLLDRVHFNTNGRRRSCLHLLFLLNQLRYCRLHVFFFRVFSLFIFFYLVQSSLIPSNLLNLNQYHHSMVQIYHDPFCLMVLSHLLPHLLSSLNLNLTSQSLMYY